MFSKIDESLAAKKQPPHWAATFIHDLQITMADKQKMGCDVDHRAM